MAQFNSDYQNLNNFAIIATSLEKKLSFKRNKKPLYCSPDFRLPYAEATFVYVFLLTQEPKITQ